MKEPQVQINNALYGITLENILNYLVENYGWEYMNKNIEGLLAIEWNDCVKCHV
jgi:uncharacterized protein (DUF2132 family)